MTTLIPPSDEENEMNITVHLHHDDDFIKSSHLREERHSGFCESLFVAVLFVILSSIMYIITYGK